MLQPEPQSATAARHLVREVCARAGLEPETCDDVALLTTEAVTNAIIHGRSEIRLTVIADVRRLRVEVADDNTRLPVLQVQDTHALDGRGIALLDALASRWGVDSGAVGKVVWFEKLGTTPPAP